MWMYAVYCVGAFNLCQGNYYTESNPQLSYRIETEEECKDKAIQQARAEAFRNPGKNIHWRCIDISNQIVTQDK